MPQQMFWLQMKLKFIYILNLFISALISIFIRKHQDSVSDTQKLQGVWDKLYNFLVAAFSLNSCSKICSTNAITVQIVDLVYKWF